MNGKEKLLDEYNNACNKILEYFTKELGFSNYYSHWIADRPGEIADVSEYTVDMQNIIDFLNYDMSKETFHEWYEYCLRATMLGITGIPNLKSFHLGCPVKSEAEFERLEKMQAEIEELKAAFKEELSQPDF
ncbi:MAG: hypothetical protein LBE91_08175 [Tannerella sp.]|jgi:hypothetical protein|nr:hypothetical protein [Tannerella sp.]